MNSLISNVFFFLIFITAFLTALSSHAVESVECHIQENSKTVINYFNNSITKNVWDGYNAKEIHFGLGEKNQILLVNLNISLVSKYKLDLKKCSNHANVFLYENHSLPIRSETEDVILQCSSILYYRCDFAPEMQRLFEESDIVTYFYPAEPSDFHKAALQRLENYVQKASPIEIEYPSYLVTTVIHEEFHAYQQKKSTFNSNRYKHLENIYFEFDFNFDFWGKCMENDKWRKNLDKLNSDLLDNFKNNKLSSLKKFIQNRRDLLGFNCAIKYETWERFEGLAEYVATQHLLNGGVINKDELISVVDFIIKGPNPYYSTGLILASYLQSKYPSSWQKLVYSGNSLGEAIIILE